MLAIRRQRNGDLFMIEYYGLSPIEYQLMKFFWKNDLAFTFNDITTYFAEKENKIWKKQTLHTHLTHLIRKQALIGSVCEKGYKKYKRSSTKKEYIQQWTSDFLNKTFDGSVGAFVRAATYDGRRLSQKDYEELKLLLDEKL